MSRTYVKISEEKFQFGPTSDQILADPYYDFEIVDMKSFQDWIVYMSIIPCWHFLAKNIHN